MIRLVKISKNEIQPLIEIAYKDDQKLLDEYHIAKFTHVHEAVLSTMGMINEMSEQQKLSYYKVVCGDKAVGYVVVFQDFLYSFGLNIKYRISNILSEFWSGIVKVLGRRFICMLYANNERAGKFLLKSGMKIINISDHSITYMYGGNKA